MMWIGIVSIVVLAAALTTVVVYIGKLQRLQSIADELRQGSSYGLLGALCDYIWFEGECGQVVSVLKEVQKSNDEQIRVHAAERSGRLAWELAVLLYGDYATKPVLGWIDKKHKKEAVAFLGELISSGVEEVSE